MMNLALLLVLWSLLCASCCTTRIYIEFVFLYTEGKYLFSSEWESELCDVIDADFGLLEKMKPMLPNRQYEMLYKSNDRNGKLMEIVNSLAEDKFYKALQETSQQHVVNFIQVHKHRRPATGNPFSIY